MHVLVTEGLYDKDYVAQHGFGFEAFAAELAPYTPEWAYPETGIEPDVIRETAREMARYRPATLVHPGRHATWYGDDTQRSRAIALLNALLGQLGAQGRVLHAGVDGRPGLSVPAVPEVREGQGRQPRRASTPSPSRPSRRASARRRSRASRIPSRAG